MLKVLFPWKQNNTKKVLLAMEQQVPDEISGVEPPENLPLLPCHVCNRTFLAQPLKKHIPICEQMSKKKRKPFDSLKQRVKGTDLAPFFQKSYLKKQQHHNHLESSNSQSINQQAIDIQTKNKQNKWKEKHLELMNTIKAAKGTTLEENNPSPSSSLSTSFSKKVASQTSIYERCPSCDRAFGPKAFDRHVEWCKEHKIRMQISPATQQAKDRLEARIKYKVPPLRQSKRFPARDKNPSNNITPQGGKSTSSLGTTPNNSMIMNRKKDDVKLRKDNKATTRLTEKVIGDCGDVKTVQKSEIPVSKSATPFSSTPSTPFETAHRQLMELFENDDRISVKSIETLNIQNYTTSTPSKSQKNQRASVIDPPFNFQDDEFEYFESLANNNLLNDTSSDKYFLNLENSIYRKYSNDNDSNSMSSIDPKLINSRDNLSIPDNFALSEFSPNSSDSEGTIRNFEFRQAPDGSSAELDDAKETKSKPKNTKLSLLIDNKPKRIHYSDAKSKKTHNVAASNAVFESKKDEKNISNVMNLINSATTTTTTATKEEVTPEELFPVDDEMYEEYKKYEEIYLKEKDKKTSSRKQKKKPANDFGIKIEDNKISSQFCGDSAYGSLNRKVEIVATDVSNGKPSKFCHECGNKYPITSAKFCVECGVKRLVL